MQKLSSNSNSKSKTTLFPHGLLHSHAYDKRFEKALFHEVFIRREK